MRAEEILPDNENYGDFSGVTVRKGTVTAFLANAKVLSDSTASPEALAVAKKDIIDALPALRALGLFDVLQIRDEKLRTFIDAQP